MKSIVEQIQNALEEQELEKVYTLLSIYEWSDRRANRGINRVSCI